MPNHKPVIDISGNKYGSWTVLRYIKRGRWLCRCEECKREVTVYGYCLKSGESKSCGKCRVSLRTHGLTRRCLKREKKIPSEYNIWQSMKQRCQDVNLSQYKDYGGRGVKVCERWKDYLNFYADMGPRPSVKHSLDRVNNDGNYEPSNCKWVTRKEQNRNKRSNRKFVIGFREMCLSDAAELYGIRPLIAGKRLRRGWNLIEALERPVFGVGCKSIGRTGRIRRAG